MAGFTSVQHRQKASVGVVEVLEAASVAINLPWDWVPLVGGPKMCRSMGPPAIGLSAGGRMGLAVQSWNWTQPVSCAR